MLLSSITFDSIPDELCVEICSRIVAHSTDPIKEISILESVSKSFQRVCVNAFVLRHVPFEGSPIFPRYPFLKYLKYLRLFEKFFVANNPWVIYREGMTQYFEDQLPEGLERLAVAANMGVPEAKFFYGVILMCLGGEGKKKGFELLTMFVKPVVDNNIYWLNEDHADYWLDDIGFFCQPMLKHLKRSYVRDQCNCDGVKDGLIEDEQLYPNCARIIRSKTILKLLSSSSCEICLCHHLLQRFFDLTQN